MSDLQERLIQAEEDRAAINKNIEDLKKQIADSDKKFYIGEKFVRGRTVYQLIQHGNKVALVVVESHDVAEIGYLTKNGWHTIPIMHDKGKYYVKRYYVKQLPTTYPADFGLDSKYGYRT